MTLFNDAKWHLNDELFPQKSFPSVSNRNNFGHLGTQYPFSDSMTPKTPYDVNLRSNDAMWHPLTLEWCQILVNDARVTFHTPNDTSLYPNYCYNKVIPPLCTQSVRRCVLDFCTLAQWHHDGRMTPVMTSMTPWNSWMTPNDIWMMFYVPKHL